MENPLIDDINNYGTIGNKKTETPAPNLDFDSDNKKQLERSKRQSNRNNNNNWIKFLNNSQNGSQNTDMNDTKQWVKKPEPITTTPPPVEEYELTEREEKELQENLTNWLAVIYNSNEKLAKRLSHSI